MKKTFKKVLAIMGICAVLISTFAFAVSADDTVIPSSNIEELSELNKTEYLRFKGISRDSVVGSPFYVYHNKTGNQETWDSNDRFSLYLGSGQYDNIGILHRGVKVNTSSLPSSQTYYMVNTTFTTEDYQSLMSSKFESKYETFIATPIDYAVAQSIWNPEGNMLDLDNTFFWLTSIPYIEVTRTTNATENINVIYTFNEYVPVDNPTMGQKVERKSSTISVTISPTNGTYYIPRIPISYDWYNDRILLGTTDINTITESGNSHITYLFTDVECSFTPNSDIYGTSYVNFELSMYTPFESYEGQGAYWSIEDWLLDYKSEVEVYPEVNAGEFLADSALGFLKFEIYPGLSLMGILAVLVAIPLLIAFLKIFAGG